MDIAHRGGGGGEKLDSAVLLLLAFPPGKAKQPAFLCTQGKGVGGGGETGSAVLWLLAFPPEKAKQPAFSERLHHLGQETYLNLISRRKDPTDPQKKLMGASQTRLTNPVLSTLSESLGLD